MRKALMLRDLSLKSWYWFWQRNAQLPHSSGTLKLISNGIGELVMEITNGLVQMLCDIEAKLPALRARCPDDGDFIEAFATLTEDIEKKANELDDAHDAGHCWILVHERFDEMLRAVGIDKSPWYTPA